MLHVYTKDGKHVAIINKQPTCSDGYRAEEPWLLLHNTGRVDRFYTQTAAKEEALKTYSGAQFQRS